MTCREFRRDVGELLSGGYFINTDQKLESAFDRPRWRFSYPDKRTSIWRRTGCPRAFSEGARVGRFSGDPRAIRPGAIGLPDNREKYREMSEAANTSARRKPCASSPLRRIFCRLFANNRELQGKIREFWGMELGGSPQLKGKWQKARPIRFISRREGN